MQLGGIAAKRFWVWWLAAREGDVSEHDLPKNPHEAGAYPLTARLGARPGCLQLAKETACDADRTHL